MFEKLYKNIFLVWIIGTVLIAVLTYLLPVGGTECIQNLGIPEECSPSGVISDQGEVCISIPWLPEKCLSTGGADLFFICLIVGGLASSLFCLILLIMKFIFVKSEE